MNKLLKGEVSARYVPVSALVLAALLIDLWLVDRGFSVPHRRGLARPVPRHARQLADLLVDLVGIAFAGGMFIVPLYAILQTRSPAAERSRIIAANNIVNAGVTVLVVAVVTGPARCRRRRSRR